MAKVENKCSNCKYWSDCPDATNNMAVIWKHCGKFNPTLAAIAEADERRIAEKKRAIIEELSKL